MPRRRENQRGGFQHVRQRAGIVLRLRPLLGKGNVAGIVDEFAELPVGDGSPLNPEDVSARG
jgi:hypothetical protein